MRKACQRYADEFLWNLKETDSYKAHTVYVSQAKETRTVTDNSEQETEDSDVETRPAVLFEADSADLEETDVQDTLLAHMESRQLRGEQRVSRGYRPATGRTSGGKPYRVEGRLNLKDVISRTRYRVCREKGHWVRMLKQRETVDTRR